MTAVRTGRRRRTLTPCRPHTDARKAPRAARICQARAVSASRERPEVVRHDNEHLRRFVAARAAGDGVEMRRWWEELVISLNDRIDGIVGTAHRGRLDDQEHEAAVVLAMARIGTRLMATFAGVSMGELVNATCTLARNICIDVQRASIAERERFRSLDAGWDGDEEDRPSTRWEADEAWARLDKQERSADVTAFLDWALPQVSDTHRPVLKLTFRGEPVAAICDELHITEANVHQRRSRGMKELGKLRVRYDRS